MTTVRLSPSAAKVIRGIDVKAVADDLRRDGGRVEHGAHDARRAVRQTAHRVVQVRRVGNTPGEGRLRPLVIAFRVRDGDGADLFRVLNQLPRARALRSHVHETHNPAAVLVERTEELPVWIENVLKVLRAAPVRRDKRPLHVHAEDARAVLGGVIHAAARRAQGGADLVGGNGHRRRAEGGHAVCEQEARHLADGILLAVTGVGSDAAVNVDIDKAGQNQAARAVERAVSRELLANLGNAGSLRAQVGAHKLEVLPREPSVFQYHIAVFLSAIRAAPGPLSGPTCRRAR